MSLFFELFTSGISCIAYGTLLTIVILAVLCLILYLLKKTSFVSLPFTISGCVLFLVLIINMSVMVGAIRIKGIANRSIDAIEQLSNIVSFSNLQDLGELFSNGNYAEITQRVDNGLDINNLQELQTQLTDNWELLRQYFESANMSTTMLFLSPTKSIERFNSKMNDIILTNILWSLVFFIISLSVGILFSHKSTTTSTIRRTNGRRNQRQADNGKSRYRRNRLS